MEINAAVMLLVGFGVLMIFHNHYMNRLTFLTSDIMSHVQTYHLTILSTQQLLLNMMQDFLIVMFPLLAAMFIAGILVNILQIGFLVTGEPIQPKLSKISPIEGFKRIFSRRSLESLIKDILKIIVIGWIAWSAMKGLLAETVQVADASVRQIIAFTGMAIFSICIKILIGYMIIAILDYAFQRWDYERSMRMTTQEVREELKQTEGDPFMRARIRSVQRELARRRMMSEVPKATVVITNPTEIAVALAYSTRMTAPTVVAKGRHLLAQKIRDVAQEAGIPIVENIILAQALYKAVEIGRPIPGELYTAVAEVLAYVYRLKRKKVV